MVKNSHSVKVTGQKPGSQQGLATDYPRESALAAFAVINPTNSERQQRSAAQTRKTAVHLFTAAAQQSSPCKRPRPQAEIGRQIKVTNSAA